MEHKLPRLYSEKIIKPDETLELSDKQTHYLKNVMRRKEGDQIRLFDGETGEYTATITALSKKQITLSITQKTKNQSPITNYCHLLFTPLAKNRMDIVIEKSVELGVTDFHPILTNRTEHRKINESRLTAQIIEATEQCERMHVPNLHPLIPLQTTLQNWQHTKIIQWGCERAITERKPLGHCQDPSQAFLIGPVGGFDERECETLAQNPLITPITLGDTILRAETASLLCIGSIKILSL